MALGEVFLRFLESFELSRHIRGKALRFGCLSLIVLNTFFGIFSTSNQVDVLLWCERIIFSEYYIHF